MNKYGQQQQKKSLQWQKSADTSEKSWVLVSANFAFILPSPTDEE